MSRIPTIFQSLRAARRKAIMPFICGGHPVPGSTAALVPALAAAGASIIEVGYPFSDPVADGPVIAAAMHTALLAGATPASVNSEIATARASSAGATVGIVAMVSYSIVHRIGLSKFITDARASGVDGLIVPDAPLEESNDLLACVRDAGMTLSLLIAPATDEERAARIAGCCSGFVYVLARAGVTGASDAGIASDAIRARVDQLRRVTELPIAVGFGVSTAAHVRQVVMEGGADAAIVGSALVKRIGEAAKSGRDSIAPGADFVRELAVGLS